MLASAAAKDKASGGLGIARFIFGVEAFGNPPLSCSARLAASASLSPFSFWPEINAYV